MVHRDVSHVHRERQAVAQVCDRLMSLPQGVQKVRHPCVIRHIHVKFSDAGTVGEGCEESDFDPHKGVIVLKRSHRRQ